MELSELVNYIKGEENTTVHVTVYREGEQLEFDIVRRTLDLPVVSSEMLTEDTGYLAITEFTESGWISSGRRLTACRNREWNP